MLHVYSNMLGRCGVRALMEAIPMRNGHDKEDKTVRQQCTHRRYLVL